MTKMVKLCAVLLCAVIALSGCGMVTVNEERYNAQAVATVGVENVTVAEYVEMVNLYLSYYQVNPSNPDHAESVKQIKESAMQALVDEKIRLNKAREMGYFDLSAEDEAEVKQNSDDWIQSQMERIYEQNEDRRDDEAFVQSEFNNYLLSLGFRDVDHVRSEQRKEFILGKLFDYMTADASADDDEVRAYYDKTLAEQKELFDAEPAQYAAYKEDGASLLLYVPEGYRHVKHILLKLPDDTTTALNNLLAAGDEGYDAQLAEALVPLEPLASEVLAKAEAGEDFDALIGEYGQDPGMTSEPSATEGYLICASSSMIPEFLEASMALEQPGDISGLVGGMYGYHIIKLIDIVPSSTVEYTDELKEQLRVDVLSESQRTLYNSFIETWRAEFEVKYNQNLLNEM